MEKKKYSFLIYDEMSEWFHFNKEMLQGMKFIREFNEIANQERASKIPQREVKQKLSMVQKLHFLLGTKEQLQLPYSMNQQSLNKNYNNLVFAETGKGISYRVIN